MLKVIVGIRGLLSQRKGLRKRAIRHARQLTRLPAVRAGLLVLAVGGLGLTAIQLSRADTYMADSEAEAGQIDGNVGILPLPDNSASGAVLFGFKDANPLARNRIMTDLADPEIYKESDDLFYLSGTRQSPYEPFPIYQSTDLSHFNLLRTYNPSVKDPAHDYCYMWAPDIAKRGNSYYFYFSARQVSKGQPCPAAGTSNTTFFATAPATDSTLDFGAPMEINPGTELPRTYASEDCPDEGCDHAIRIDSDLFNDGQREWLHYVWFDSQYGNTISAFPMDDPASVFRVTRPAGDAEERVNEASTIFNRNGKLYLFYSQGFFNSQYAMRYMTGNSVSELAGNTAKYTFSSPLRAADGKLLENHGHNSVVERAGQYYVVYHIGQFDANGVFTGGRSTYIQPLNFKTDGTPYTLNTANLEWPASDPVSGDGQYSLDVKTYDDTWVTGCVTGAILEDKTDFLFNEVCTGAGNHIIHKYDIKAFRLNSLNGTTVTRTLEAPYDGLADSVKFQ